MKAVPFLLPLLKAILCLCAATAAGSLWGRDVAAIKASGTLVIAVPSIHTPPFFYEENGELKGLDIDLAKSIAAGLGVRPVFNREARTFNDAVQSVVRGNSDIATAKISRTLARAQSVLFTDPYIVLPHALLVNRLRFAEIARGKPVAQVLQRYAGSIGVIAKSSYADFARTHFPKAQIVEFDTWDAAVDAVASGRITAAYRDAFEAKRVFKVRPDLVLTVRSIIIEDITDTIGIAVGADSYHLHAWLNLFLGQNGIRYTADQIIARHDKSLR